MPKKLTTKELNLLISDFINKVSEKFTIEKAFLYGSYAKGTAHELSDVDLLIISPDLPRRATKGMNGYRIISQLDKVYPDIELSAIHPEGLNNEITKSFYDEVIRTGKEL
jgi:predicted nucleotidyltransferase